MQPAGGAMSLTMSRGTLRLFASTKKALRQLGSAAAAVSQAARNPLVTKICCTANGFAFGDCLTQQLGPLWPAEWPSKHSGLEGHEFSKTAAMWGVGAFIGAPVSLWLYSVMDALHPGVGLLVTAGKFTFDQVVGCVLWQAAYMCVNERYRQTFLEFVQAQHARSAPQTSPVVAAC